ncbi:MAG TPA: alpha/beta hydrolase [Acidobacteriota bacterium]
MKIRNHGTSGPQVIVLHGGPGAPGSAAPLARGLADRFRVLEPWQRGSGGVPLTVERHVEDLRVLIGDLEAAAPPALVGWSWGAMLALAYAAAHPTQTGPIALVGCGTFDRTARGRLHERLEERMDDELRRRLAHLAEEEVDPERLLMRRFELTRPLYAFDPIDTDEDAGDVERWDARSFEETWNDMVRLQDQGVYPAAFRAIHSPLLMLHGAYDPHPGALIRRSLAPHLPQLEYKEWERCGHCPWAERAVQVDFFAVLSAWLAQQIRGQVT